MSDYAIALHLVREFVARPTSTRRFVFRDEAQAIRVTAHVKTILESLFGASDGA